MPIEMTWDVAAIITAVGGLFLGAVALIYKASAAAAAEDREHVKALIDAIVTVPAADGGVGPTNGRTKLLVEQTHSMSERMEKSFSSLELQGFEQTKCIKAMSEQLGKMNRNDRARIELFKEILERERVVCPHAEVVASQKGHEI